MSELQRRLVRRPLVFADNSVFSMQTTGDRSNPPAAKVTARSFRWRPVCLFTDSFTLATATTCQWNVHFTLATRGCRGSVTSLRGSMNRDALTSCSLLWWELSLQRSAARRHLRSQGEAFSGCRCKTSVSQNSVYIRL